MEITIKITPADLQSESIRSAFNGMLGLQAAKVETKVAEAVVKLPEPVEVPEVPNETVATAPEAPVTTLTVVELRAKTSALAKGDKEKQAKVRELLAKYGTTAVSELSQEHFEAYNKDLDEL